MRTRLVCLTPGMPWRVRDPGYVVSAGARRATGVEGRAAGGGRQRGVVLRGAGAVRRGQGPGPVIGAHTARGAHKLNCTAHRSREPCVVQLSLPTLRVNPQVQKIVAAGRSYTGEAPLSGVFWQCHCQKKP